MLQMMTGGMPSREYVIERGATDTGGTAYTAFWRDPLGTASFGQRVICGAETATGLIELVERHYPGAVCAWLPEDCKALMEAAIAATKGDAQ